MSNFDPQTAKGLTVDLYRGQYRSGNCVWNREDGPASVVVVAIRDESGPSRSQSPLQPLPAECRAPSTPTAERPAAVLVKRRIGGRDIWHVEPLLPREAGRTPFMAGGSYAGTSDSRFGAITGIYGAVTVHDYSETWAAYRAMTVD